MAVDMVEIIKGGYIPEEAPLTETLRANLKIYIDDQFNIIGDPALSLSDDAVIHAVQNLNSLTNLVRRVGDLENLYTNFMNTLREEALKIAEEIDKL